MKQPLRHGGIYYIVNNYNGKIYIGSSINMKRRKKEHLNSLRNGSHYNTHLQASYNKYGEDVFEFRVIVICEKFDFLRLEGQLITMLHPDYNMIGVTDDTMRWASRAMLVPITYTSIENLACQPKNLEEFLCDKKRLSQWIKYSIECCMQHITRMAAKDGIRTRLWDYDVDFERTDNSLKFSMTGIPHA